MRFRFHAMHTTPFTLRRIPPAKVKPPKPHHLFNYSKYRFHRGFSFGIDLQ